MVAQIAGQKSFLSAFPLYVGTAKFLYWLRDLQLLTGAQSHVCHGMLPRKYQIRESLPAAHNATCSGPREEHARKPYGS